MKAFFTKLGGVLRPSDDDAAALLARLPEGKQVLVGYEVPRSPRQHRLFFALLKVLVDNVEGFDSIEQALLRMKIACHECDVHVVEEQGVVRTIYVPRSIKFESMDGDRFGRLLDRALYVITTRYLAGVKMDELRAEIEAMAGPPDVKGRRKR